VIRNASGNKTQNLPLSTMYDELESNLRGLETLGVTQEQSATFLYPLVESSLSAETIQAWQRSSMSGYDEEHSDKPVDERLKSFMKFLRSEMRGAERLSYVTAGFKDLNVDHSVKPLKDKRIDKNATTPTAAGLFGGQAKPVFCVFCDNKHDSKKFINAQTMPFNLKKRKVLEKKACMACLKIGHVYKSCKSYVKCLLCQQKHVTLMCPELHMNRKSSETNQNNAAEDKITTVSSQLNCTNEVLLQTLRCAIRVGENYRDVRILLDPGSQKSYILEKTAKLLGAKSSGEVKLCHLLFGGVSDFQNYSIYDVQFEDHYKHTHTNVKLLRHQKTCDKVPRMPRGPWLSELKQKGIFVSDVGSNEGEIEVLIGSDYYANWLTGRKQCLSNGLVALQTCFGWTVFGKLNQNGTEDPQSAVAMHVMSLFIDEAKVSQLWNLEGIGIHDPVECKTREERERDTKDHFLQTVTKSEKGHYCVSLPWIEARPEMLNNREVAEKRLKSMTAKLQAHGKYDEYQKVFDDWLSEGIIEAAEEDTDDGHCHYLPHRAVFKPELYSSIGFFCATKRKVGICCIYVEFLSMRCF
jgi:hypothetical protein